MINDKAIIDRYYFKLNLKNRITFLKNYIYLDTSQGFYLPDSFKNAFKDKISLLELTLVELND